MTNLLLATGLIASLAYGYWLMARLDHRDDRKNRRQTTPARPWGALHRLLAAPMKRLASLQPIPHCPGTGRAPHKGAFPG